MPRDYYIVLGIAASASAEEIHAAFRRRSKELHPDVSGADSGPFLELQEAYSVLSDPLRRRDYDRESTARVDVRVTRRPPRESVVPLRSRVSDVMLRPRSAAEPIAPLRPNSVMNDFFSFGPSFDEFFDRGWSNFGSFVQPEGARTESLDVEVLVSAEEARRGGRLRFAMPARGPGGEGAPPQIRDREFLPHGGFSRRC